MDIERVYEQLERLEAQAREDHKEVLRHFEAINGRVRRNEVEIAGIKGRASVAGLASGAISGVIAGLATTFGFGQ